MVRFIGLSSVLLAVLVMGCGSPSVSAAPSLSASPIRSASESPSAPSPQPSASVATADIVGTWTRTQTCEQSLAAFEASGFGSKAFEWVTQNWIPDASPRTSGFCDGASGAIPHSHFFTADGKFGSRDQNGQQVDEGDYAIASPGLLTFPRHASEFNYSATISVRYAVKGNEATFDVQVRAGCVTDAGCAQAYAWALSAFFSGPPWTRS